MAAIVTRVRGFLRRNAKVVIGVAACALGVSAALAVATVPDNGGTIHSCYKVITLPGSGIVEPGPGPNLRIIDSEPPASQTCDAASDEVPLDFNQRGPAGAPGAPGTPGQESADTCRHTAGHLKLSGSPGVSTDVCAIWLVRIGHQTSSRGAAQSGTTEYEVERVVDSLSPKLSKATASGTAFKSATIAVYKPGTTTVQATYKLNHVAISSYQLGLGLNQPTERLTLVALAKKGV
jgi:Type VI secretion system effector, Hcp